MSVDEARRNGRWPVNVVIGAAAFVVVLVGLAGLERPWRPGAREGEAPGAYSRILTTYEKRVSSNPGLSYTENFAALRCDAGDRLLSGGFSGVDEGTVVTASEPETASSAEAWLVGWENDASPDSVNIAVLCAEAAFPPHE